MRKTVSMFFLFTLVVTSNPALAVDYETIFLDTFGGISSNASGINVSGQVVGYSDTSYDRGHAFFL